MNKRIASRENWRRLPVIFIGGAALYLALLLTWMIAYQLIYAGRIFPGVYVAGVELSGLRPADAALKLSQTLSYPITGKVLFRSPEQLWVASPSELGMVFDPTASANAAYAFGRTGNPFKALLLQAQARGMGADVSPVVIFDQRVAYRYLQNIAAQIDQPQVEASLKLEGANVAAQPGQVGRLLNLDATMIYLGAQLQTFRDGEAPLVIAEAAPRLLDVSSQAETARLILSQPLTLSVPNARDGDPGPWTYDIATLANMIGVSVTENNGQAQMQVGLNPSAFRAALSELKTYIDREPENARFVFNDESGQIEPILASKTGRVLDVEASIAAINAALLRGEHRVELVVSERQPDVADTASGAELGVTQLVAQHTTYFYGSSAERIQNIAAAAERYHGVLVAPNEIFSMGKYLGDVSLENGFAEALIIYGGRTIKGVGGGVCQVSTTLFRTVFFAGYPVIERYSHAYRVVYYEKTISGATDPSLAGLDATVYFPLVDFKFQNDTPYWILMETYVDVAARKITWKMYSTSDGRSVTWDTSGPTNVVPPPEPILEENPDLKADEIKQVDYAAQGADVTITRTVWRGGAIYFTDEFRTHYQSWAAICQYGPGTENPEKKAKRQQICFSSNS
ncbi:MAG: VanW family protein [Anaerolineales bacterium]